MSHNEWESGEFKLSVAEYRDFKKRWREGYNAYQDATLARAIEFWEHSKTLTVKQISEQGGIDGLNNDFSFLFDKKLPNGLMRFGGKKRPRKPIRKDFARATNKITIFEFGDTATVAFVDAERRIVWYVSENNHACDTAREHRLGGLFFRLLDRVEWTRGTGGKIIGNDEYNRQNDTAGGGANYVKSEYGPTTPKAPVARPYYNY